MFWLVGQSELDDDENEILGVDWVLHYEFGEIDQDQAVSEFHMLMQDMSEAGLRVQVRHGHGMSLLICIRVPRDHLGKMIYQSRVKDWLFEIAYTLPVGNSDTTVTAEMPAEEIRSIFHAVTWPKELGGAGITPNHGKWKNITASFPLHDQEACSQLLHSLSDRAALSTQDLDKIRALFGERVAFYYEFIYCYSLALIVPTVLGIFSWIYLGPYSIIYGITLCIWCIVFVEYWKIRETDLSMRWGVKGVGGLKVDRAQYTWEREVQDPLTGQVTKVFPTWKQFLRQLLLVPLTSVAAVSLGSLILVKIASEVFIANFYNGSFKEYVQFLPIILFSLSLPAITSFITTIATRLTDYENYRTQDQYDLALAQKTFVMNFITSFLPTIITAFVYVPFGRSIAPQLGFIHIDKELQVDTSRFQQEVIYLSMTGQVFKFIEEILWPYAKRVLWQKYRNYQDRKMGIHRKRSHSRTTDSLLIDSIDETSFLRRLRSEADADTYKVGENILGVCVQFGYLAFFGVAWPLVPLGLLLINWLALRGDFFKLTLKCQRPPPIRADSIGPCLLALDLLAWLGTISTATIIQLYRRPIAQVRLFSLLLTLLLAEQAYLAIRFTAARVLKKIFADTLHREETVRYAVRKQLLEVARGKNGSHASPVKRKVRFDEKVDVYLSDTASFEDDESSSPTAEQPQNERLGGSDREAKFWNNKLYETADAGVRLIQTLYSVQKDEKKRVQNA
ncbi:Anoctamin/TMEM 16 [Penicillium taxi]|uniref:Anoctamin/TMEM 16 n=1 Tax=Penicillium taxi TaxID=168475 RepID=UPI0025456AC0|nr:Anoctamin/TMEM 16 [Penicillium taxi]KAJ5885421.1 Anoctamin/TMEM 16 [Penicillium taxi]